MSYHRLVMPREISHGNGSLGALKRLAKQRVFLVTDNNLSGTGHLDTVRDMLGNVPADVFTSVTPDPTIVQAKQCAQAITDFRPDMIIGLGGGSSIDVAKVAWVFYEHPGTAGLDWRELHQVLPRLALRQKSSFVAIPTTSGSGSEVSPVAVITDNSGSPAIKHALYSTQLVPDLAILDTRLVISMPPLITATTGFDALVHAVECYVAGYSNDTVDALAVKATRIILEWLPIAVADGDNTIAREKMHLAASMAMMAMANSSAGLNHDLAHQLGALFKMNHGQANALMIGYYLGWQYTQLPERVDSLALELGINSDTSAERARLLITRICDLRDRIGLANSFRSIGIPDSTLLAVLDNLIDLTLKLGFSRIKPDAFELRGLILKAMSGEAPFTSTSE